MEVVKKQQGITLVELIIGMAISTIILTAIVAMLSAAVKSHQFNFQEESNIQDARTVLNEVSDQLRFATSISSPAVSSTDNKITYRLQGDTNDRSITQGTNADKGFVLLTDQSGNIRKLGAGRIMTITFSQDYAPQGSSSPCKRLILVKLQAMPAGTSSTPEPERTVTVVTFNSF